MKSIVYATLPMLLIAGSGSNAEDNAAVQSDALQGIFNAVIQEDCVYSASGFGPGPLFLALGPTTRSTGTLQGTARLTRDGSGDMTVHSAVIGTNPSLTPALRYALTCPIRHSVNSAGEFEAQYDCTGTTTLGSGSQIALEVFQSGMKVSGHARRTIVSAAGTELAIEMVGSTAAPAVPRMCHRTFQLLKPRTIGASR